MRRCRCTSDFLPLLLSLMDPPCAQENFEFWEGAHDNESLTNTRCKPLDTTDGSSSPSSPSTVYLPTNEKPLPRSAPQQQTVFRRIHLMWNCLHRPERRIHYALFWLISKKMSAILFCAFVRSFFLLLALLFVQNVSLSWWMYCAVTTYLPALVWICCFYVWGRGKETRDRNPGLKKKIRSILYTM